MRLGPEVTLVHGESDKRPPADPATSLSSLHRRRWRRHKGFALLVGGLAGGLAGYANATIGTAVGLPFALHSEQAFLLALTVLVAPFVEEHVKLFSLFLLRFEERAEYAPRRWLALGALSGIGFGIAEAILYWQMIAPESLTLANLNLLTRMSLTVPMHGLAVTASAYGYGRSRIRGDIGPLVVGLLVAILLHAAFNGLQMARSLEGVL